MRRWILGAGLAWAWLATSAAAADYPALFDKVWSTVDENFYDPGFNGADWKVIGERYRARVAGVKTDKEFAALASAMLKEIGTSHLYLVPPRASSAAAVGVGMQFTAIAGQDILTDIAPLSDAHAQGLLLGARLVSPKDALYGALGTTARARFEDCEGRTRAVALRRIAAYWPPPHPGFEWWTTKVAQGKGIGYLRIDRFDDGAAALADRAMDELKDTAALIVDVRENSGGNASGLRLQSYFAPGEAPAFALFARPFLAALGHKVGKDDVAKVAKVAGAYTDKDIFAAVSANNGAVTFWSEDVGAKRYIKPVVVLIGPDTGSAGEGFAWMMRLPQVKLVGRRTAGALLSGEEFDLPDGWSLTVPVQGIWSADGVDYRDRALDPDIAVAWARKDVCTGRDPDIEAALAMLR
ncbi:MAG TPA: S41 family peptidase [Rhizomicrobium sp.]|nr:S41 family peptidase [Rhizomicrobium sp.]